MIEVTWSDIFKILVLLFGFGIVLKLILWAIFGNSDDSEEHNKEEDEK